MPQQEHKTNVPLNDSSCEVSPPPIVACDDLQVVLGQIAACICAAGLAPSTVGVAFTAGPPPTEWEKPSWCELAGAAGVFVCRSDEPSSSLCKFWESHADLPPPQQEAGQEARERMFDSGAVVLRSAEVIKRVGISRTSIWRWVRAGEFPAPISLGRNSVGWPAVWIDRWLASRPRVYYPPPAEDGETQPGPA